MICNSLTLRYDLQIILSQMSYLTQHPLYFIARFSPQISGTTNQKLTYSYISWSRYLPLFLLLLLLKSKNIYWKQKFLRTYIKYIYEAFMCVKNHKMWCAFRFGMNSLITKPRNQSPVSSACWSLSVCKITKNNSLSQIFCMFSNTANTSKSQNISHIKETLLENFKIQDH